MNEKDTTIPAAVKIQKVYRGYKTRKAVLHQPRIEFEDILKEIEGNADLKENETPKLILTWPRRYLCLPQFIDPFKPQTQTPPLKSLEPSSPSHIQTNTPQTNTETDLSSTRLQLSGAHTNDTPSSTTNNSPTKEEQNYIISSVETTQNSPLIPTQAQEPNDTKTHQQQNQNTTISSALSGSTTPLNAVESTENLGSILSATIHEVVTSPNTHRHSLSTNKTEPSDVVESSANRSEGVISTHISQPNDNPNSLQNSNTTTHSTKPNSVRILELQSELEWVRSAVHARKQYLRAQTKT
eukprot:TRINITY_DN5794_c0_g1_i1.p1 TRINITY_DN5794_c0_g1~~TRINITY_DN5794_c0_g1_i1.p1  ORF type:complete len:297 (+),score=76.72 TRINITY_DN5794_c0_g1_i1:143-1033(+)